jgi:hypothetical protein
MGGLMLFLFLIRFFLFPMRESPKYLMSRGRDAEAVEVVHYVASYNGTKSSLTLDMLRTAEGRLTDKKDVEGEHEVMDTSAFGAVRRTLSMFETDHVVDLFKTRKLAWSTSLLIVIWGTFV